MSQFFLRLSFDHATPAQLFDLVVQTNSRETRTRPWAKAAILFPLEGPQHDDATGFRRQMAPHPGAHSDLGDTCLFVDLMCHVE